MRGANKLAAIQPPSAQQNKNTADNQTKLSFCSKGVSLHDSGVLYSAATSLVRQVRKQILLVAREQQSLRQPQNLCAGFDNHLSDAAIPAGKLIQGVPAVCPGATSGLSPSTYSFEE